MKPYEYSFERRPGMAVNFYTSIDDRPRVGHIVSFDHYYTFVTDGHKIYALTKLNCWPRELSGNSADNIQNIPKEDKKMSIKDRAKKSLGGSELIQGREKLDNDLLIAAYPNGITIDGIDLLTSKDDKTGEDKQFTVYTFKEDPKRYAAGGQILTEMFRELVSEYENLAQFNEALRQEGGLRVKLSIKKSKNSGNKYTAVEILD